MAEGNQVSPADLELESAEMEAMPLNLKEVREEAERRAIIRALSHSNQNISDAADALGITRPTLYNLMEKLRLRM